jgi:hypothetical protein
MRGVVGITAMSVLYVVLLFGIAYLDEHSGLHKKSIKQIIADMSQAGILSP